MYVCVCHIYIHLYLCRHFCWRRIVLLRGQTERRTLRYFTTCCLGLMINSGKCCHVLLVCVLNVSVNIVIIVVFLCM